MSSTRAVVLVWRTNPFIGSVETCIFFVGIYLIRKVRSVKTKRMRGTKEKNRMTGRIQVRILSQHPLKGRETQTISQHPLKGRET